MKNIIIGFFLATSSMLYELILAQILNISLGGTIFQYTITIGIYATSLGIGSLWYQNSNATFFNNKNHSLFLIELGLAVLGSFSVFIAYMLQYIFFKNNIPIVIFQLIVYFLIFTIGLLSGLELPLLMDIETRKSNSFASQILFVDYLGTLSGCLLFPLFFLPYFNLIETLFITALFNLSVALVFSPNKRYILLTFLLICLNIWSIFQGDKISEWLSYNFIA